METKKRRRPSEGDTISQFGAKDDVRSGEVTVHDAPVSGSVFKVALSYSRISVNTS